MVPHDVQAEQQKHERRSDPVCICVHCSIYPADGTINLNLYREHPKAKALPCPETILDLSALHAPIFDGASVRAPRNLVKSICPQDLSDAVSLEEFKSTFLQIVRCHRITYMKTKALHDDLTIHNIFFTRDDAGVPSGFLSDWDFARPLLPDARHQRTGTAAFMAVDLLSNSPPRRLYRHDLESFLYILLWSAVNFNLPGVKEKLSPAVSRWATGTWREVDTEKLVLFSGRRAPRDAIFEAVQPVFRPILQTWVKGPFCMFMRGFHAIEDSALNAEGSEAVPELSDDGTIGGRITYETFMAALGEPPRIATFDLQNF